MSRGEYVPENLRWNAQYMAVCGRSKLLRGCADIEQIKKVDRSSISEITETINRLLLLTDLFLYNAVVKSTVFNSCPFELHSVTEHTCFLVRNSEQ